MTEEHSMALPGTQVGGQKGTEREDNAGGTAAVSPQESHHVRERIPEDFHGTGQPGERSGVILCETAVRTLPPLDKVNLVGVHYAEQEACCLRHPQLASGGPRSHPGGTPYL